MTSPPTNMTWPPVAIRALGRSELMVLAVGDPAATASADGAADGAAASNFCLGGAIDNDSILFCK